MDIKVADRQEIESAIADDMQRSTADSVKAEKPTDDAVNHPSHYTDGIEVIDYIESKGFGYCLGNACKYISRCGKKDPGNIDKAIEDLEKAIWYINRRIRELRQEKERQADI